MDGLPGYVLDVLLHDGADARVYRGVRELDQKPIIAKVLKEGHRGERSLTRFQLGYDIGVRVAGAGIVEHLALERLGDGMALIFGDDGGESLDRLLVRRKPTLKEILSIGARVAEAIGRVHEHQVIHKDIKPHNVVYAPAVDAVKLIDFGISSQLTRETPSLASPGQLEGTLAYISPEQTGRMNRSIDSRSDLYSLGVTLYQLLTSRLPFDSKDPLELIHCHLARLPAPPREIDKDIPEVVSDIVMKLLAKRAEDRYQTAFGLRCDLETCLERLHPDGTVPTFEVGTRDVSDRFLIPQRLYGREEESRRLLESYTRASKGGRELLLVAGYSGIGKSALIHEVHRPIVEHRGYFCSGKFDQFRRDLPYRAIIDAFRDLLRQVLTESAERVEAYRVDLMSALAGNGRVIADVIPELEALLGELPEVEELAPNEARNRFDRVFKRFLSVFARPEHPLAIFLDDLQWADLPSLHLMKVLISDPDQGHLLVLGAYRDNEVDEKHPFIVTLGEIEELGQGYESITLTPLDAPTVGKLIADTLHRSEEDVSALGALVHDKTRGNPFFVGEFLRTLYADGQIDFVAAEGRWRWDLEAISGLGITDNVVDLVAGKLKELPAGTLAVLKVAACLGSRFDLRTLAMTHGKSHGETASELGVALKEGLVLPGDDSYKYMEALAAIEGGSGESEANAWYRFLHDRVHQAAYSLLDVQEAQEVHLRVGRLLHEESGDDDDEFLMDIANHFDMSKPLITDPAERRSVAEVALRAGRRAKASLAVEPAANYLSLGLELLPDDAWESDYALALDLHTQAAEALFLSQDYEGMQARIDDVRAHAREVLDEVPAWNVLILANTARNENADAIYNALGILAKLGVKLPKRPGQAHILAGVAAAKAAVRNRPPRDLVNLPDMTDPKIEAAMGILMTMVPAAFFYMPAMFPVINFKMVRLSCKYGNTGDSAYGYVVYGMILSGVLGQIDRGYEFGGLAFDVMEKYDARSIRGKVIFVYNSYIRHWKEPLRRSRDSLLEAWRAGVNVGDNEYAAYALNLGCPYGFFIGMPLPQLRQTYAAYIRWIHTSRQETPISLINSWDQLYENLSNADPVQTDLVGDIFDVHDQVPKLIEGEHFKAAAYACIAAGIQAYLFGDYERAAKHLDQAEVLIEAVMAAFYVPTTFFYQALTACALKRMGKGGLRKVNRNIGKFRKWAKFSETSHQHKLELLLAEKARAQGRRSEAMSHYSAAMDGARRHGFVHEEGIATERFSESLREQGLTDVADTYLSRARTLYHRWGAVAKVAHLDAAAAAAGVGAEAATVVGGGALPTADTFGIGATQSVGGTIGATLGATSRGTSSGTMSEALDLSSVMKAARALSSEIELAKLTERVMNLVIENAGAEAGLLLLDRSGALHVAGKGQVEGAATGLTTGAKAMPKSVIAYVQRTQEPVVLENATKSDLFSNDPYIVEHEPRSALASPILNQGKLVGIVYLENNLSAGVFTPDRLAVLEMLCAQAAVSIENARHYEEVKILADSFARFVPIQFLEYLGRESIAEVELGDSVVDDMTVLFSDLRRFTSLSEGMTAAENIKFINSYLARITPPIQAEGGFVDKFIGDAVMALVPGEPDRAVAAAVNMQRALHELNEQRVAEGREPLAQGIGLHIGTLMLGTVGSDRRMDTTVIGDTVNLASRIESMTKHYGANLLVSREVVDRLLDREARTVRLVGRVRVKGKTQPVEVWEVADADPPELLAAKVASLETFRTATEKYFDLDFAAALILFRECLKAVPGDGVVAFYIDRCRGHLDEPPPEDWVGVDTLRRK